jgi:hypothetical protein
MDSTILGSKRPARPPAADRRGSAARPAGTRRAATEPGPAAGHLRAVPDRASRTGTRPAPPRVTAARRAPSARPAAGVGTQSRPQSRPAAAAAPRASSRAVPVPRAPFILLVLALLGGGMVCLLLINTTLGSTSFEIDKLQQAASARSLQEQQLQQQLAADESPAKIEQEACALGMRPQQRLEFLDLRKHRVISQPAGQSGAATPAWCAR